jgi:catechol 2,3-dioxygenase-like lactoylglutathione lyase family enzyme
MFVLLGGHVMTVHHATARGNHVRMSDEAIPVLHVSDAARAVEWYRRLGFEEEWVHRFGPTFPAFVSLGKNGASRVFLSEHRGDARPDTLVYMRVPDVDAVAQEFEAEIVEQPWAREVHLTDPDGNRLRIGTPAGEAQR